MKGKNKKPAKLAGREKFTGFIENEDVVIEYLELVTADTVTEVTRVSLLRINHDVIEAASADCQNLVGKDRAGLEARIIEGEESGVDISLRSLVGINYIRFSFPSLDAQLILPDYGTAE